MSTVKEGCSFLLVTANVGSIFEDPEGLLKIWIAEFFKTITDLQPLFIALHCQEVGGKTYESSMKYVQNFVKTLLDSEELMPYTNVRVFLDEDFTRTENFTALVVGKEIFSGNIEDVSVKEKAKFPQQLFPECKWSRKGFMRTRWLCENFIFDLTNIHLFHDASNFIAMESFPSQYTIVRQNALQHVLDKFCDDQYDNVPLFIFGDFNFRLDMKAFIEKITKSNSSIHNLKSAKNGSFETITFKDPELEDKTLLTLGKKIFELFDHDSTFINEKNHTWLLDLDKESKLFENQLHEFNIKFPPSYPFIEETTQSSYMKTRCPAWCDRILLNKAAMDLIRDNSSKSNEIIRYDMIGRDIPMGDHKPILLWFNLVLTGKWKPSFFYVSQKDSPERMHVDNFFTRLRTYSIPSMRRPHLHFKARRTTSAFTKSKAVFHNQDWCERTQELFHSMRLNQGGRWPSRRLTSHHSSSSEEWYTEFGSFERLPDTKKNEPNVEKGTTVSSTVENIEFDQIINKSIYGAPANCDSEDNSVSLEPSSRSQNTQVNCMSTDRTDSKLNETQSKISRDPRVCPCRCIVI